MSAPAPRPQSSRRPARSGGPPAGAGPAGPAGRRPGPGRPPGREGPSPERLQRLVVGFTRAFLEVESGRRPRRQLLPVLCPRLALRLADVWVRPGPPGHVVSTYGRRVAPDRYEAVAVVRRGERFGAVVVAMARTDGTWRVVDAARPEDLPGPASAAAAADVPC